MLRNSILIVIELFQRDVIIIAIEIFEYNVIVIFRFNVIITVIEKMKLIPSLFNRCFVLVTTSTISCDNCS